MRLWKKLAALLCALLLLSPHALAAFSPALDELETAWQKNVPAALALSASVEKWDGVSEKALSALNRLLENSAVHMAARQSGESYFKWQGPQGAVLEAGWTQTPQEQRVVFPAMNEGFISAPGEQDVLSLLTGEETLSIPQLSAAQNVLWSKWDAFYALLEQHGAVPKAIQASTSIRNVGTAGQYDRYVLSADALNAAWPALQQWLQPVWDAAYPMGVPAKIQSALSSLVFHSDGIFRRVRDKAQTEWGLQFDGQVSLDGQDIRKSTLIVGWRMDRGFLISLTAPSVSGGNTLKVSFGGAYTVQNAATSLKLEGACTRTVDNDTHHASLEGSLKSVTQESGDAISGKITVTQRATNEKNTYTIKPDFQCSANAVQGDVHIASTGKNGDAAWTVHADLKLDEGYVWPTCDTWTDWTQLGEQEKAAALHRAENTLTRSLMTLVVSLPQEDRALLTHLVRTGDWMTAPSVPLMENDASLWIVEEETEP